MLLLPFNRCQHEPCQRIDQFSLCSGYGDHLAAPAIGLDCTALCRGLWLFSVRLHDCSYVVKKRRWRGQGDRSPGAPRHRPV
jgi:hypothetical protein